MATRLIKSVYTTLWTSDHSICHIQQNLQNSPNKATMVFMKSNIWSLTQRRQNIDHLFQSLVLPKISYGLPVYASSVSELNTVQEFLRRCLKRRFISYTIDIYYFLEKKKKKQTSQSPRRLVAHLLIRCIICCPQLKNLQNVWELKQAYYPVLIPNFLKLALLIDCILNILLLFN